MQVSLIGDCGIDDYVDRRLRRPGGCTFNAAAHLKGLAPALDVAVLTALGTDPDAAVIKAALGQRGLRVLARQIEGATPVQRIRLLSDGEKSFVGYQAGVMAAFLPDAAQVARLADSDVIVTVAFEQVQQLTTAVTAIPRRGRLVVDFMDMADFDFSLARIEPWLQRTDIAFFGLQSKQTELIAGIERWQRALAGRLAIVTLGSSGAIVMQGQVSTRIEAVAVKAVVDTTGAGDAFLAAFLSGYLHEKTPVAAAQFAARHAAGVVERFGAS